MVTSSSTTKPASRVTASAFHRRGSGASAGSPGPAAGPRGPADDGDAVGGTPQRQVRAAGAATEGAPGWDRCPGVGREGRSTDTLTPPAPDLAARAHRASHLIDGQRVDPPDEARLERVDPATGEPVASAPVGGAATVARAVASARAAARGWARTPAAQRAAALSAAADALEAAADELAEDTRLDMGRPPALARGGVDAGVATVREYAVLGPLHRGRRLNGSPDAWDVMELRPRGVAAVVTAWNDPVAASVGLLAAALVTGNTVVWKPSERAVRVSDRLAGILAEHLPPGVLSLVHGDGTTGAALVEAGPDVVAHVGSTAAGRSIAAAAARTGAHTLLENGGKDALVVDAGVDPVWAAQQVALGGYINSGQLCTGVERVYVHTDVFDAVRDALVAETVAWTTGPSAVGPLVDLAHREAVHAHVAAALAAGATALTGGRVPDGPGAWYPPTVLVDVPDGAAVLTEETFGPVVPLVRVDSFDEALRRADDSAYGLAATVLTPDLVHARRACTELAGRHGQGERRVRRRAGRGGDAPARVGQRARVRPGAARRDDRRHRLPPGPARSLTASVAESFRRAGEQEQTPPGPAPWWRCDPRAGSRADDRPHQQRPLRRPGRGPGSRRGAARAGARPALAHDARPVRRPVLAAHARPPGRLHLPARAARPLAAADRLHPVPVPAVGRAPARAPGDERAQRPARVHGGRAVAARAASPWVWNEYMVRSGVRHEIGLALPHGPDAMNVVVLQRSGQHDFDDRDRLVLRLLRPHLAAALTAAAPGADLTARQVQVLRLVRDGLPDKSIARRLGCAEATVGKHLEQAFRRLGAHSRTHALQLATHLLDEAPGAPEVRCCTRGPRGGSMILHAPAGPVGPDGPAPGTEAAVSDAGSCARRPPGPAPPSGSSSSSAWSSSC